jgi:hypothetical protein
MYGARRVTNFHPVPQHWHLRQTIMYDFTHEAPCPRGLQHACVAKRWWTEDFWLLYRLAPCITLYHSLARKAELNALRCAPAARALIFQSARHALGRTPLCSPCCASMSARESAVQVFRCSPWIKWKGGQRVTCLSHTSGSLTVVGVNLIKSWQVLEYGEVVLVGQGSPTHPLSTSTKFRGALTSLKTASTASRKHRILCVATIHNKLTCVAPMTCYVKTWPKRPKIETIELFWVIFGCKKGPQFDIVHHRQNSGQLASSKKELLLKDGFDMQDAQLDQG